jgi:hypothetical protein
VQAELGILVREYLRLRSPEPVRGLEAMHGVGGADFAGLDDEGKQACSETQQDDGIGQPPARARVHDWMVIQGGLRLP